MAVNRTQIQAFLCSLPADIRGADNKDVALFCSELASLLDGWPERISESHFVMAWLFMMNNMKKGRVGRDGSPPTARLVGTFETLTLMIQMLGIRDKIFEGIGNALESGSFAEQAKLTYTERTKHLMDMVINEFGDESACRLSVQATLLNLPPALRPMAEFHSLALFCEELAIRLDDESDQVTGHMFAGKWLQTLVDLKAGKDQRSGFEDRKMNPRLIQEFHVLNGLLAMCRGRIQNTIIDAIGAAVDAPKFAAEAKQWLLPR